jgi:cytochrome c-type biogenesis protein CcmH
MSTLRQLFVIALLFVAGPAFALIETYDFSSPALQSRYQMLSAELRCPKCQNQNIADSNAPISQDLRKLLHQQLEQGASDQEILDSMVARYGEFVRYRPSFSGVTAILWLAPALLLAAGLAVVFLSLRSRRGRTARTSVVLNDEEQQKLHTLLNKTEKDS